jgi:neutral ceramidase
MEKHGRQQFEFASQLSAAATERVTGPVDFRLIHVDFSKTQIDGNDARTWPAALGFSFAAGSTEDSTPYPFPVPGIVEGITDTEPEPALGFLVSAGLLYGFGIEQWNGTDGVVDAGKAVVPAAELKAGHSPKLIAFVPSSTDPPWVPQVLPVQLLRIGSLALVGIPGELSTMAGRRLRKTIRDAMKASGIKHVALGTYANDYSQYITTEEEYKSQQYEGASTLFGPMTLRAYQQVTKKLANAMVKGSVVPGPRPTPTPISSPIQSRYRIRNLSRSDVRLRFYNTSDSVRAITLPNGDQTIPAGKEYSFPEREFTGFLLPTVDKLAVWRDDGANVTMAAGQLLTIAANGSLSVGPFTVPPRQ